MAIKTFTAGEQLTAQDLNDSLRLNNNLAELQNLGRLARKTSAYGMTYRNISRAPFLKENHETKVTNDASYSLETSQFVSNSATTNIASLWDYQIFKNIRTSTLTASATDASGGSATVGTTDDTTDIVAEKSLYIPYRIGGSVFATVTPRVYLTDGTNDVLIVALPSTGGSNASGEGDIQLFIDWTNKKVSYCVINARAGYSGTGTDASYFEPETMDAGEVDISSLTGSALYVQAYVSVNSSNGTRTGYLYLDGIYAREDSPTTTITESVSTDGGSTFTTGTGMYTGLTSGSLIVGKLEANVPSTETLVINHSIITGY